MILGISEAPQTVSFAAMAERQQALAARHPAGSRRGEPVVVHRRRRHQHDAQQRPHPDQPQAARASATPSAIDDHPAPAAAGSTNVDGITLYMQPVQDLTVEDRVEPHAVPVHAGRRRRAASSTTGRRGCVEQARSAPRAARRRQRSAGPAACRPTLDHRPRHRLAPRHHAAGDRRHALRRLRPAAGLDDLHAAQPVPRRARGRARSFQQRPRTR